MSSVSRFGRILALLAIVSCTATVLGAGSPLEYVKTRTLQNLNSSPTTFLGHYLAIDDTGKPVLSTASNQSESGSLWELKYNFWRERGYITYSLIQRGNNKFNGQYLAVDPTTGGLYFSAKEIPTARWLVRYAGKYAGWDATYIQNLAQTGTTDMQFLAINETTGAIELTAKPTGGAHWLMSDSPYLPAESLY